jgi:hypothetical protein
VIKVIKGTTGNLLQSLTKCPHNITGSHEIKKLQKAVTLGKGYVIWKVVIYGTKHLS